MQGDTCATLSKVVALSSKETKSTIGPCPCFFLENNKSKVEEIYNNMSRQTSFGEANMCFASRRGRVIGGS